MHYCLEPCKIYEFGVTSLAFGFLLLGLSLLSQGFKHEKSFPDGSTFPLFYLPVKIEVLDLENTLDNSVLESFNKDMFPTSKDFHHQPNFLSQSFTPFGIDFTGRIDLLEL